MCHRWEASNGNPGVGDLYLGVMDALYAIDDRAIYFIEGAGQQNFVTAWGDGFVIDAAIISQHGLSDPRPFFDALLKKAYVNRVRTLIIMQPPRQNYVSWSGRDLCTSSCKRLRYLRLRACCSAKDCC